jgi:hypothetical protein
LSARGGSNGNEFSHARRVLKKYFLRAEFETEHYSPVLKRFNLQVATVPPMENHHSA